jgi:hypothetical protein
MTRTSKLLIVGVALALAGTGCASAEPRPAPAANAAQTVDTADFETVALEAAGFAEGLDEPVATPSAGEKARDGERQPRPRAVRKLLRKNTLHGEVVVEGKDGVRTIVVQRGEVTAADDKGFTVKSTDGFEQSWSFGDPVRVVQNREKAEPAAVRTGVRVAVGGVRDGASTAARLVVIR